ncbi:MAG: hypothetical protein H7829_09540 [Magnetococcus sp. THC-1_WYH]
MKKILNKSTEIIAGMVVGGVAVLTISSAFSFTVPYTFTNGTAANADQVNANFNAIKMPTLVSNGTVAIGSLLGFSGSNYSGMTQQGYLFQIDNAGSLSPIAGTIPITTTTTLQARWTAAMDAKQQYLTNNQGGCNGSAEFLGCNNGTLYFDNACTVTTRPTLTTPTNNQENVPATYVVPPSVPVKHLYKVLNDNNVYVFAGNEPTFNGVAQTFSFTPYFKSTSGALPCVSMGATGGSTDVATLLNGSRYFQTYPTNVNNPATTGVPNAGFAPPISIEMK